MSNDIGLGTLLLGAVIYFGYQAVQTPSTKQVGSDFTSILDTLVSTDNIGENPLSTSANGWLTLQQVHDLAQALIDQYGFNVSADEAAAIAIIESGDISMPQNGCNPKASHFDANVNDTSSGLMQVEGATAAWLASSMGYSAFGVPSAADLYSPQEGMYFGLAYLDYLSKYSGTAQTVAFVVQSYNAGPGHTDTAYLTKYNLAQAWLLQNGI